VDPEPDRTIPGLPLARGLGWVAGPIANSFLLREGPSLYLIDAGYPERAPAIVAALDRVGLTPRDLSYALLTHQHPDHMGGASYLRWAWGTRVACHAADQAAIQGQGPRTSPLWVRLLVRRPPVQVDRVLRDGDTIGPFTAVHVPGHTPGSVAFYHAERKFLFTGDAVVAPGGRLTLATPSSTFDPDQAISALEKLARLEVRLLLPGHGRPVSDAPGERLRTLLRERTARPAQRPRVLIGPEGRPEMPPHL
jgi:glyoxylase-like metal-dependent hydrolase (beta-lactamase superfamily II)